MRARLISLLLAVGLASIGSGASAGTLVWASWLSTTQGLVPVGTALGVPVIATGTSTSTSIAVSLTLPSFQGGFFMPDVGAGFPDTYRSVALSGAQALVATPLMATATMGVTGENRAKLAAHVAKGPNASMLTPSPFTLLRIPLSVGGMGFSTGSFVVSANTHYFTVDHYGWAIANQTFTGLTYLGSGPGSTAIGGYFDLTAMGGGNVLLVAPSRISIDGAFLQRRSVMFTLLQLEFVPEPSALLLLGAVVLVVALRGRYGKLR
jgi:hypothetical protein